MREQPMMRSNEERINSLDEYTIFLMLEKERTAKLREVYRSSRLDFSKSGRKSDSGDSKLPKFPPRYQCLDLPAEWFVSESNRVQQKTQPTEDWNSELDQETKMFLQDMVNALRERYGCGSHARLSPLPFSATTITPPSSPLTLPYAPSEDSLLPIDLHDYSREVDMSDEDIRSLWTGSSEDGVEFDVPMSFEQ